MLLEDAAHIFALPVKYAMIKTFIVSDGFLINDKVREINNIPEAEVYNFDEESDAAEIVNSFRLNTFFSAKRIIILKNAITLLEPKETVKLLEELKDAPETDIYFFEKKAPAKSPLFAWLKTNSDFRELVIDKKFDLVEHIKNAVQKEGGEISPLAAERLASFVGPDLWRLSEEIKKLVNYKYSNKDEPVIDTADISLLVHPDVDLNIFNLIDAFATKNTKKAAELVNDFIDQGVNELYLLTMIWKQFRNIAMAKFETNVSDLTLVKKAGLHPFVAKKTMAQARNFDVEDILRIYEKLAQADHKLKSGSEPKQVLLSILT